MLTEPVVPKYAFPGVALALIGLLCALPCLGQTLAPFNRRPVTLRPGRPAANAAEERAREEAVFRYYAVHPSGKPGHVAVRLNSPIKRMYRTRLREAAASGTRFAGTVGVLEFGCGTGCVSLALADQRTGESVLLLGVSSIWSNRRVVFRPDSRALLITGEVEEKNPGERWYVWTGPALQLVSFQPLSRDCFGLNEDGKLTPLWNSAACDFMPP